MKVELEEDRDEAADDTEKNADDISPQISQADDNFTDSSSKQKQPSEISTEKADQAAESTNEQEVADESLKCDGCGDYFSSDAAVHSHAAQCITTPVECQFCPEVFLLNKQLKVKEIVINILIKHSKR